MSKAIEKFGKSLLESNNWKKLFSKHSPGNRIFPPKNQDAKMELRLDAGEVINGKKTVYLQVNSQAKNGALKKWRQKNGTHANLAVGTIDENAPEKDQKEAVSKMWESVEKSSKSKVG